MNIEIDKLIKETSEEVLKEIRLTVKTKIKDKITHKLNIIMMPRQDIQKVKDNPEHYKFRGIYPNDPDLGYITKWIDDQITEVMEGELNEDYIRAYLKGNYKKKLDEVMDKALLHRANKEVFTLLEKEKESN